MIKLIASDMDNTLLNNKKEIPAEIFPLIKTMKQNKTIFCVASARNYFNLSSCFEDVKQDIAFICDNGAYVEYNGKVFAKEAIDKYTIKHLIDFCKTIPDVHIVLCAKEKIYFHNDFQPKDSNENLKRFNIVWEPNFKNITADIFRFGLMDPKNPLNHSIPLIKKEFGDELNIVATDEVSVDIMNNGVNKGSGVASLQKALNISINETMAFGDYYNDIGMLQHAKYSFAMENALDDVKKHCNYIAKSNDEKGVIKAIEQYYLPTIKR